MNKKIALEGSTSKAREYFTPGEISMLLDQIVSRTTVSRLFDQGKLTGFVDPLTGRRVISWHSVIEWLKSKGMFPQDLAVIDKKRGQRWTRLRRETQGTTRNKVFDLQISHLFPEG